MLARDVRNSELACVTCRHSWNITRKATRDTFGFVKRCGNVIECPQCGKSDSIEILKYNGEEIVKMDFPNKCTSREAAIKRYGAIDLAHGHWLNQNQWIKMLDVPSMLFPNWKVLDSQVNVTHIACNIDIHKPLLMALNALHARGLGDQLHTYDGCFNIRAVRGSSLMSTHAYGLGIDINAQANPMGQTLHTNMPAEFVKCFTEQGFAWGGNFHARKDPMHFSYAWEG